MTARPIATQFPGHGSMDDLTTERSFDLYATWRIGLLFDMLLMGVCTTRRWHTSGRLVQKVNVSTVYDRRHSSINDKSYLLMSFFFEKKRKKYIF